MASKGPRRKKKFSWYLTWTIVFLFFIGLVVISVIFLPIFEIQAVRVVGTRLLDQDRIARLSKSAVGQNIFLIDLKPIELSIEKLQLVKKTNLIRSFPNNLIVEVIERKEAAVAVVGGETLFFDEESYILNSKEVSIFSDSLPSFSNLPVIVGIRNDEVKGIKLDKNLQNKLRQILVDLKDFLQSRKTKIDLSQRDDIVLFVDDFMEVRIGDAAFIPQKLKAFQTLRQLLGGRLHSIDYIDVSVPENPAIKYRE